ncbi:MAG TPA: GMC oxidoreductase [Thermoleophilaceae bacterium]
MTDVVVVGGGAAGCVVAARVAAAGSASVLLLEAGPDLRADTPAALRDGWRLLREYDWGYQSEPNARGKTETVTRRKLLGGTSWLTRFALRGAPGDYDAWAAAVGSGWSFDDVLPYFTRLEADREFGHESWHGDDGPIPVTRYPDLEFTEAGEAAVAALRASGFPEVEDHNRPGAVGVGRMPMNSISGQRVTTVDAYLPRDQAPPKLETRAGSEVACLVFDGTRVRGVELLDGTTVEAGEVVLCAGAYGSPAILMRSGVGPASDLQAVGIDVLADLPGVGANLVDHPATFVDCGYRGPAAPDSVLHAVATFHSSLTPSSEPPDLMIWTSDPEADGELELGVVLLKPHSRGSVRLRSAAGDDAPRIALPALDDPRDVERLTEGYRIALDAANRPELRALCDGPAPSPDGDLTAAALEDAYSIPHAVGTCAMGSRPEAGAVVDATGRVHGVEGVRIVDASIMPDVPSGFTHFPTIMIAERLAEEIATEV